MDNHLFGTMSKLQRVCTFLSAALLFGLIAMHTPDGFEFRVTFAPIILSLFAAGFLEDFFKVTWYMTVFLLMCCVILLLIVYASMWYALLLVFFTFTLHTIFE